jgi:hypothetical protein
VRKMADANAPEKNWWRWFEKDTLISIVSALGLDVIFELIKKEGPVVAWTHFKKDLDEKILTDKRAEMLREFRKMEDAGINIDNLRRRHAESMDRSKVDRWAEYRFVQLLCKIQPPDPANPQKVRPPIVPGKPGKPQNDRQADLKWLNDQGDPGDPRFDQMMHLLDHDVVTQMFQIGCDRTARFLKNLRGNLKVGGTNVAQWLRTHFGALGDWIVDTAEATLDLIVRFFRWLSGSWLRVTYRQSHPAKGVPMARYRHRGSVGYGGILFTRANVIGQNPLARILDVVGRRVLPLEVRSDPQHYIWPPRPVHADLLPWGQDCRQRKDRGGMACVALPKSLNFRKRFWFQRRETTALKTATLHQPGLRRRAGRSRARRHDS